MARTVTLSTGSTSVTLDVDVRSYLTDDGGFVEYFGDSFGENVLTDDDGNALTITYAPNHATSVTITEG